MSVKFNFTKQPGRPAVATIYVKTVPGRRAYWEGRQIPNDKFVPVPFNSFFRRLIDHHQDVEVENRAAYEELKKPKPRTTQ